ncbi:MAG: F0F1 ATP synthase subunit A [Planctomycetes bacterium]|nr:F0F1 ATP synthase subunit A [Planctomycetota bacterium]
MMEKVLPALPLEIGGYHFNYVTIFNSALVVLLAVVLFRLIVRRLEKFPGRGQILVEMFVSAFDGIVCQAMGRKTGRRFLPLIGTLFIFILLCNVIGILPLHSLTWGRFPESGLELGGEPALVDLNDNGIWDPGEPFVDENQNGARDNGVLIPPLEEPTKDINLTLGVALWLAVIMYVSAMVLRGPLHPLKDLCDPVFMAPINAVGKVAEVVSVSFRLFGNIFGGVVIMAVVGSLAWLLNIGLPIGMWAFFGLFVGTVQAFVYTMLWLTYISNEIGPGEEEAAH